MTKLPQPELFAERPVCSEFARNGPPYALRRMFTLMILLGVIIGGLCFGFSHSLRSPPNKIPTIKTEGNYKLRPAQPGGIDIPHQDVQVYRQLDNVAYTPAAEHLLPPPETPQPVPGALDLSQPSSPMISTGAAQVETWTSVSDIAAQEGSKLSKALHPEIASASAAISGAPPPAVPLPMDSTQLGTVGVLQAVVKPLPAFVPVPGLIAPGFVPGPAPGPAVSEVAPASAAVPVLAAKPAPRTVDQIVKDVTSSSRSTESGRGPAVQLAASLDASTAEAMALKLQIKYAAILGAARLHVARADLGARGIYYRIQSQPLSGDQARAICKAVKKLNVGCALVRR
jgi:hypothetical protein